MAKSELTLLAEFYLIKKAMRNCERYGLEVGIGNGRVDFVTSKLNYRNMRLPEITCYEIKVSISDFNSENGHNLVGDYNYYVVSEEVFEYMKTDKKVKYKFFTEDGKISDNGDEGLIVIKNSGLRVIREAKKDYFCKLTIENKITVMDNILLSWTSGSMFKYLTRHGIILRNDERVD